MGRSGFNDDMDTELPTDPSIRPRCLRIPKLTDVTAIYKPSGNHDIALKEVEGGGAVYLASWGNLLSSGPERKSSSRTP